LILSYVVTQTFPWELKYSEICEDRVTLRSYVRYRNVFVTYLKVDVINSLTPTVAAVWVQL